MEAGQVIWPVSFILEEIRMRNLDTIDFLADEATEIALKVKDRYVCCQLW